MIQFELPDGSTKLVAQQDIEQFMLDFPDAMQIGGGEGFDEDIIEDTEESVAPDIFTGTGWGKTTKFVQTGVQQDESRGTFKAEQTSTFENVPGTSTFPTVEGFDKVVIY